MLRFYIRFISGFFRKYVYWTLKTLTIVEERYEGLRSFGSCGVINSNGEQKGGFPNLLHAVNLEFVVLFEIESSLL